MPPCPPIPPIPLPEPPAAPTPPAPDVPAPDWPPVDPPGDGGESPKWPEQPLRSTATRPISGDRITGTATLLIGKPFRAFTVRLRGMRARACGSEVFKCLLSYNVLVQR